jgi:hypothetical protein
VKPTEPVPVKLICGLLYSDADLAEQALLRLSRLFGRIDYKSPMYPFTITDYYNAEMGTPILRQFISFQELIHPLRLPQIKIACNAVEEALAISAMRKVNLDPGYMDYDKLILASAKYNGHKVYLDQGIYADVTMRFEHGGYQAAAYAFPDFKTGQYQQAFLHIRARYKGQLRQLQHPAQD